VEIGDAVDSDWAEVWRILRPIIAAGRIMPAKGAAAAQTRCRKTAADALTRCTFRKTTASRTGWFCTRIVVAW
jgi:hypothetical protein